MATIGGYNVVTDGLVLSLDAANRNSYVSGSSTWFDASGNRNSGSLFNSPTYDNVNGGSVVFDGINDYMDISNAASFQTSTLTIDIWTKILEPLNNSGFKGFFSTILSGVGNDGYQLVWSSAQYFYFFSQTIAITAANGSSYPSDTTFNLVCRFNTVDFSLNSIFFNGIDVTTSRFSTPTIIQSPLAPRIGGPRADNNTLYFLKQNLFSVRFYNRVLSTSEILQNYNATKGRFGL